MGMNDVAADADVRRDGHAHSPPGRRDAQWAKRELFFLDRSADGLAQTLATVGGLKHKIVQAARLLPQAKLAALDPFRDVLARAATPCQLEIVDDARAVGGEVSHEPALDEIDEIPRQPEFDGMAPHHQDDGPARSSRVDDVPGDLAKFRMRVFFEPGIKRLAIGSQQVVSSLGQVFQGNSTAIEQFVTAHGRNSEARVSGYFRRLLGANWPFHASGPERPGPAWHSSNWLPAPLRR